MPCVGDGPGDGEGEGEGDGDGEGVGDGVGPGPATAVLAEDALSPPPQAIIVGISANAKALLTLIVSVTFIRPMFIIVIAGH